MASVLKKWLRELPEPLFTFDLYDSFIAAVQMDDLESRLECYRKCVENFPPGNKIIAARIFALLNQVAANNAVNKMTAENIGIVFAPGMCLWFCQTIYAST